MAQFGHLSTLAQWQLADATSWIEIDLPTVEHNAKVFQQVVGNVPLCAVVKKDAYGLGATQVASRLTRAGVPFLAVFNGEEAKALIQQSITTPIMVMMPFERLSRTDELYRHASEHKLHLTLHDRDQFLKINEIVRDLGIRMPVHLHLDTGMSRGGMTAEEIIRILSEDAPKSRIRIAGLYTHLVASEQDPDYTQHQVNQLVSFFNQHKETLPNDLLVHAANTCATLRQKEWHLNMVRVGIGFSGMGPEQLSDKGPKLSLPAPLRLPLTWKSRIIHATRHKQGAHVGYLATTSLKRDSLLGVVPVGYGDGYPLALSNKSVMRVKLPDDTWFNAPVMGRINMDQVVLDLTDAFPECADPVSLKGTMVEVISNDPTAPNCVPKLAQMAGTSVYEFQCGLSTRVPRFFIHQHTEA